VKNIYSRLTSVRGKILFGFAVIIVLVLGMILASIYQLRQVQTASMEVLPGTEQVEYVQELASASSSLEVNLDRLFVTGDVASEENIRKELAFMRDILTTLQIQPNTGTEETINQLTLAIERLDTAMVAFLDADRDSWLPNDLNRTLVDLYAHIDAVNALQQQLLAETLANLRITAEIQQSIIANVNTQFIILGTAVFLIAIIATFVLTQTLRPISTLTEASIDIAGGNLDREVPVESNDELGTLAEAFNSMTGQMRDMVGNLEQRVSDRTRALEASMEVSRSVSTILDQQQLLAEVAEQVRSAFDYYHVHIYLNDEMTNDLVMVGGTGEAGSALLGGGHKITQGTGLVGRAADSKTTILISDVTQEEGWLPNPLLPDTKTEIAVPILINEQVLGVLDVQQNELGSLTEVDTQLLELVANQVAIALRNARLYEDVQKQAKRESITNAINQRLQTAPDIDSVLQIAAQELGKALNSQRTTVQLGTPESDNNGHQEALIA
jgi:GAF domain-containing protein/HAMP domain-containing protein